MELHEIKKLLYIKGNHRVKRHPQNGEKNLCKLYIRWEINIKDNKELEK